MENVGYILSLTGVLIAGGSWIIRNRLREKNEFPTRTSNMLELLGPLVGFVFVALGLIFVLLA
jgi:hypothetical protein